MKTDPPLPLPEVVARYLDAANRFDAPAAAACFAPDSIVHDEGREHAGAAAIEAWVSETSRAVQPQVKVTSVRGEGGRLQMTGTVAGNFPGSPVELHYDVRLRDGKIARLTIQ